jgi:uncharacterized integral membrane protein
MTRNEMKHKEAAFMKKQLQGIALILFGILLGVVDNTLNMTLLYSTSDFPFALLGLIVGVVGLVLVFQAGGKGDQD